MKLYKKVGVFGLGRAGRSAVRKLVDSGVEVFAWDDKNQRSEVRGQRSEEKGEEVTLINPPPLKEIADSSPLPLRAGVGFNNKDSSLDDSLTLTLSQREREVSEKPPETWPWEELDTLVLSPGIPYTHPEPHEVVKMAQKAGCDIICDVELLYNFATNARYIGITGTNGKSTTTALIGHIAKECGLTAEVGGNIGIPASGLAELGADGLYVLELSSYQLDLIHEITFNVAILLNITPDHLDRHGGMEGYIAAKKRIFANQKKGDTAIIAVDDEITEEIHRELINNSEAKVIPVSSKRKLDGGVSVIDCVIYDRISSDEKQIPLGNLTRLPGKHNAQNIATAYAAMASCGVPAEKIAEAVKTFSGLDHRLQYIGEKDGVTFINDSKATNAVATSQALSSFNNIYWIAGGVAKDGGIESLEEFFPKIKHAFLIGEAKEDFAKTLSGKVDFTLSGTLENAVAQAVELTESSHSLPPREERLRWGGSKKNAVILLSPACASFDHFKDFEARGDAFCKVVNIVIYL